jgi:chaperonin GroEL (HSP60 family)
VTFICVLCTLRMQVSQSIFNFTHHTAARTQDEEVGDGTTSVIILAGQMLSGKYTCDVLM